MDASITSAIIAGIGVIMTAWLGFAGTKKGTLATAEKDFRETILQENRDLRDRVDKLEDELIAVKTENHELKMEIIQMKGSTVNGGKKK